MIVALYVIVAEMAKRYFYRKVEFRRGELGAYRRNAGEIESI